MTLFNLLRKKRKETSKIVEISQHGDLMRKNEIKYGIGYRVLVSDNVEIAYMTLPPKLEEYRLSLPQDLLPVAEIRHGNVWPSKDGSSNFLGDLLNEDNKVIEIFKISELEKALDFCLIKSNDFAKDFIERGYTFIDKSKEQLKMYKRYFEK